MSRFWYKYIFVALFFINFSPYSFGGKRKSGNYSKEFYREEFFKFSSKLFNWASFAKKKQKEGEPLTEIYFRIKKSKLALFGDFFDKYKDALYGVKKYHDLNIVNGQEIIPSIIYSFIANNFGIVDKKEKINENVYLLKLIGGNFIFNNKKEIKIKGFLQVVEEFDLYTWRPIRDFINNFKDTLTLNSELSQRLGRTMLPLVEFYYNYMDVVSRFHVFKELSDDYKEFKFTGEKKVDAEKVAIKIFQSSGPILIKLLQEMQEEVSGHTAISDVLTAVKISKPMEIRKVKSITKSELKKIARVRDISKFKIRDKPLGIASIAQAHLFRYQGNLYVVKVQKSNIKDIYVREKQFINRMVSSESVFDKGMKQQIINTNKGIEEELDYNFERKNIELANSLLVNREKLIETICLPSEFFDQSSNGTKDVLVMSLAKGEPLGSILERESPDEIKEIYSVTQRLYEQFLYTALSPLLHKNFYHGDLHRENIFYDLKTGKTTIIDFGNGGTLSSSLKDCILQIYQYAQKTNLSNESVVDEAIVMMGKSLEYFILNFEKRKRKNNPIRTELIKVYFRHSFNPSNTIQEKLYENKRLQERLYRLESEKLRITKEIESVEKTHSLELELKKIQDNIDFVKALTNNCLNGPVNPLLSALGRKGFVSDKLRAVFRELQKNGIVMPKEIIFFNKSNGLLQGMLTNLSELLDRMGVEYKPVEPDDIFNKMIKDSVVTVKSGD